METSVRALGFALATLAAAPAFAQAPGALSPGPLLQEGLRTPPVTPETPFRPPSQPQAPGPGEAPRSEGDPDAPANWDGSIQIRGITERGFAETRLPRPFQRVRAELQRELNRLREGNQLTIGNLETVIGASTKKLRDLGYITSLVLAVPTAAARPGEATPPLSVVIVASYIGRVEPQMLKGGTDLKAHVLKMLQPVVGGNGPKAVFNSRDLQRQVRLINTFGSVKVDWFLKPGTELGESILYPVIRATPTRATLLMDNNVPLPLGTWRLGASVQGYIPSSQPVRLVARADNAFSVPGGFVFGTVQATTPIGNEGWSGELLWATTSTNSKDLASGPATLQTGGISNYYTLGLNYPLLARDNGTLSVGLKGTIQNSTNDLYLNDQHVFDLNTDRIRAVRLSLDGYTFDWKKNARAWTRLSQLNFVLSQGFSGLDSGLDPGEVLSNIYAHPNFTTARLYLTHQQLITGKPENGTVLSLIGTGQASRTALPVPEQFVYGGPVIGRGFNSAYILGDQGWAGSLELGQRMIFVKPSRNGSPERQTSFWPFFWYDYGFTSYRNSALANQSASTYGIGARGSFNNERTGYELGWGIPSNNTLQPNRTGPGNSILYFRISHGF
jgi:hemolysin activation/secretion protein